MDMDQEPSAEHALGKLIDSVKLVEAKGGKPWSDLDLARRAQGFGHRVSKSNMARLRVDPIVSVSTKQIRMLQAALQVPADRILDAFLESMGFRPRGITRVDVVEAVNAESRLSSDKKEILLALYRFMLRQEKQRTVSSASDAVAQLSGEDGKTDLVPVVENGSVPGVRNKGQVYLHRTPAPLIKGEDVNDDSESPTSNEV